ncbi:Peptidyl-tRNA hydrolase protein 2, mitochondrial [Blomia tropicalis]|nr:Peptidyl-tRNA hydrolase protein 2, mitochondrial [Blomia tropicalis]
MNDNVQYGPKFASISITLGLGLIIGWNFSKLSRIKQFSHWIRPNYKLVLVVRSDLRNRTRAQIATHCSSASILAVENSFHNSKLSSLFWRITGQTKVVVKANSVSEFQRICNEASKRNVCTSLIKERSNDKSIDESIVLAVGPAPDSILHHITGNLKLY